MKLTNNFDRIGDWKKFSSHMADTYLGPVVKKYGKSGQFNDLLHYTGLRVIVWNLLKYSLRLWNGSGKQNDFEKITHYAQMGWTLKEQLGRTAPFFPVEDPHQEFFILRSTNEGVLIIGETNPPERILENLEAILMNLPKEVFAKLEEKIFAARMEKEIEKERGMLKILQGEKQPPDVFGKDRYDEEAFITGKELFFIDAMEKMISARKAVDNLINKIRKHPGWKMKVAKGNQKEALLKIILNELENQKRVIEKTANNFIKEHWEFISGGRTGDFLKTYTEFFKTFCMIEPEDKPEDQSLNSTSSKAKE